MICGSGGWKSRLAKAAGAEAAGQMGDEKVHAVVARSTFPSENVQNTPGPDHFCTLRCRKSARRCGAKHISKSKCTKHTMVGPLLEVAMSKKCTPLWREAHFQVKSVKNWRSRTTFWSSDVEKVSKKCTPLWREAHFEVKMYKTHHVRSTFGGSDVDFRKSARRCGAKHISKSKCTKHTMFGPLLEAQMSTFEKVHAVVARSTFPSQNVKDTRVSDHFWRFSCRFPSLHSKIYTTLHDTTLHYTSSGCGRDLLSR